MFDDKLALAWLAIFKSLPDLYCFPRDMGICGDMAKCRLGGVSLPTFFPKMVGIVSLNTSPHEVERICNLSKADTDKRMTP